MLYDVNLPNNLLSKAIFIAVYLKNRSPIKWLSGITFYKSNISNKSDLSNLRKFGYIAYYYSKDSKRIKLDNKGIICIFLGYKSYN